MIDGRIITPTRCLSGNTAEDIQKVDPQFIKAAQIEQSLTPGRNNGFLNMLKSMKDKATALDAAAREAGEGGTEKATSDAVEAATATESSGDPSEGPKYNAIVAALQALKPTTLILTDNSHEHAGHAGNDMDGESHFDLQIVAEAFEGLNLVKRHQLIYMILGEMMPQIHALQIQSLTPAEVEQQSE
jgi:stress-induced morphogen